MSRSRPLVVAGTAGLVGGVLILGIGGRIAMRVVAFTEPAPPHFTWIGTLEVLGAGAAWGAVTGPLFLVLDRYRGARDSVTSSLFGVLVLGLASLAVGLVVGFDDAISAPPIFVALSAVLFLALFLGHGLVVGWLVRHWRFVCE